MSPENREFKKTPLMLHVEASNHELGQSIEGLVRQEYVVKKKSISALAVSWGISHNTVSNWIELCDIPKRTPSDEGKIIWAVPEIRQNIVAGIKRGWQDKNKKAKRVKAIHNEVWLQNVRVSVARLSNEERKLKASKVVEYNRKAHRERMAMVLGEDPKQGLISLIEKGLSTPEIAVQINKTPEAANQWLKEEGLKNNNTSSLKRGIMESRQKIVRRAKEIGLMQFLSLNACLVLNMRYDNSGRVIPLKEIGQKFTPRLTRQRIGQIEAEGLSRLEQMLLDKS